MLNAILLVEKNKYEQTNNEQCYYFFLRINCVLLVELNPHLIVSEVYLNS